MKIWAWIVGGVGVAAGAWWYFKGRAPTTAMAPEDVYPEGVIPGVTPGYPIAPSVDELPPDPARSSSPAMGETNAPATQSPAYQAPVSSVRYGEPTTNASSSSGASYAVGDGIASTSKAPLVAVTPVAPKVFVPLVKPVVAPALPKTVATPIVAVAQPEKAALPGDIVRTVPTAPSSVTSSAKPLVTTPEPIKPSLKPEPIKVTVMTYKSPVTSATRTVVAPAPVAVPVVAVPKTVVATPTVIKPLSKPLAVIRPTTLRGVYAVGADFTEAEYRAMGARAELETKRREWAANQMAERTNALKR